LAAYTGARQGEILALRWENIDFKAGTVTIQNSVSIAEKGHTVSGPKTRSSIRRISLPPAVMNELRQWKDIIHVDPVNKLIDERAYNKPKDFIVHTYDGKFVNPRNFVKAWKKLLEESGLRTIRFHDLRHTHATFLIQSGINIKAISARLGHSTAKMTLDVYSHLTQPMEEGITATLQELALTGSQA
jgi:integrase